MKEQQSIALPLFSMVDQALIPAERAKDVLNHEAPSLDVMTHTMSNLPSQRAGTLDDTAEDDVPKSDPVISANTVPLELIF